MPKTTTIREIATHTGYSRSTVGAALQNRSDIAESTRKKIHKAAKDLSYKQDAEVNRLMGYLRRGKGRREAVSLALLHDSESNQHWSDAAWNKSFFEGAQKEANKLGFKICLINAREYRGNYPQLEPAMSTKGIRGIIFDNTLENSIIEQIDLSSFCGVRAGTHPWESVYNSACSDYAHNIHLALKEINHLGYKRPGLALTDYHDKHTDHLYHGTFLWWQQNHIPENNWISPLIYDYNAEATKPRLLPWLERNEADVVILNDGSAIERIKSAGYAIPKDLGIVHLNVADDVADCSGIIQNRERSGMAAIDILAAQFSRGDAGPPDIPRTVMIRGFWKNGDTLARKS